MATRDQISSRLASLQEQMDILQERLQPLQDEINLQDEIIGGTEGVLYGLFPSNWEAEEKAKAKRARAVAARAEAARALRPLRGKTSEIRVHMAEAHHELSRLDFAEVKLTDLKQLADGLVTQIAAADTRLVDIASEQAALREKMVGVNQLCTLEDEARQEADNAQEALEKAEGDVFISGVEVDLSARKARIAKAAKRLSDASQMARGSKAARPRLGEAIEALEDETAVLEKTRHGLIGEWWANRKRQEQTCFRATVDALVTIAQTMSALDQRTSDSLGGAVLNHLRAGIRVPVKGGTEPVVIPPHDAEQCLAKLTAELSAALSTAKGK